MISDGASAPTAKRLISIIIPVLNEEDNVDRAYEALCRELNRYDDLEYELIFTDNHSTDRTFAHLQRLALTDRRVKVIRFVRNFGFNRSIMAGYRSAAGAAAIQIDCDLQDPPETIHRFIELWRRGHDVVVGVREQRPENRLMVWLRRSFYALLDSVSETPHQADGGDFRLVDRGILDELHQVNDARPYVRGLISDLARNPTAVAVTRRRREAGRTKFGPWQLVQLALDGIAAHSTSPLRLASYGGLIASAATAALTGFYVLARLVSSDPWPGGFATTTVLILFGISLNALFLGIIGEYIARIYEQVRVRPQVVIEQTLNLDLRTPRRCGDGGDGL